MNAQSVVQLHTVFLGYGASGFATWYVFFLLLFLQQEVELSVHTNLVFHLAAGIWSEDTRNLLLIC